MNLEQLYIDLLDHSISAEDSARLHDLMRKQPEVAATVHELARIEDALAFSDMQAPPGFERVENAVEQAIKQKMQEAQRDKGLAIGGIAAVPTNAQAPRRGAIITGVALVAGLLSVALLTPILFDNDVPIDAVKDSALALHDARGVGEDLPPLSAADNNAPASDSVSDTRTDPAISIAPEPRRFDTLPASGLTAAQPQIPLDTADSEELLAIAESASTAHSEALELLRKLEREREELSQSADIIHKAHLTRRIGVIQREIRDYSAAEQNLRLAESLYTQLSATEYAAEAIGERALIAVETQDLETADRLFGRCITMLQSIGSTQTQRWRREYRAFREK